VATTRILASYLYAATFPRPEERSLEDFFVNRFGLELYETFFREYTEKVWGCPCREIDASWGRQRVKGLSDRFENLFLVGRNGMHRYNNQDHSMLTAMAAVDAIAAGSSDKAPLWAVNTEPEYHERRG
jgi:UDP-galactopyranose mutase